MKKFFLFFAVFAVCFSSFVFSAGFTPTLLKLSAPQAIHYEFDGSELEVPVTIKGTPASVFLTVYTKDMGESIGAVHSGHLGYHYVNKIDTMIYISDTSLFDLGTNVITWDGTDVDGNAVPAGAYTYYVWGFDSVNAKQRASAFIEGAGWYRHPVIEEVGEDGGVLNNPLMHILEKRWAIGSDPIDETMLETCYFNITDEHRFGESEAYGPTDWSQVYTQWVHTAGESMGWAKWTWVPNGEAILDDNWGEDLVVSVKYYAYEPGVVTDGNYLYTSEDHELDTQGYVPFHVIDFDGTFVESYDLSTWITKPAGPESGCTSILNMGVNAMQIAYGKVIPFDPGGCVEMMLDPMRALDSGDPDDYIMWVNQNGDYINDKNWKEDDKCPWDCMASGPPYKMTRDADANLFMISQMHDLGAISFTLMGPDGKGIDWFSFAGETAAARNFTQYVDSGSPFDGIYCDNKISEDEALKAGIWFIGHDSIKGVITSAVAVADNAPAAISVAQNSPNPFNPSTTIDFSLVENGNVMVDVFNVAGQKIDTLINENLSAGNHSVTWEASGFSAGVYFYTVKTGDFTKTMKMTLLK